MTEKKKQKRTPKPLPVPPPLHTLEEAKVWLRKAAVGRGARCPCCDRYVKIYKRKLNASMAFVLLCIYRYNQRTPGFFHVPSYLATLPEDPKVVAAIRGDWAKMASWGWALLEEQDKEREDGNPRAGYYRITGKGEDFVHGRIEVPSHGFFYDYRCLGYTETQTTIKESLANKFNYTELMNARADE